MELRAALHLITGADCGTLFCNSSRCFRFERSIRAQFSSTRISLRGLARFSCLLGGIRISFRVGFTAQHMG